jgi:adenylate cyclase
VIIQPKPKILIVEDEPDFFKVLRIRLEANGYDVIWAEDGQKGLDMARNANPDLIIMDVMLPKMSGFSVTRLLKFDEKYRKNPIIIMSARTSQKDIETGLQSGADIYLTKPFKSEELLEDIEKLLKKK